MDCGSAFSSVVDVVARQGDLEVHISRCLVWSLESAHLQAHLTAPGRIDADIGRGFKTSPAGNLAYIHKATESAWFIKELNKETLRSRIIAPTLEGSEDFCVMSDGTILMGRGNKLYKYHPKLDTEWFEIADFRYYGINAITRLAVNSRGQLALVGS